MLRLTLILSAILVATPMAASAAVAPSPTLGTAEGRCRSGEHGPALLINVVGLKDRRGNIKAELYPDNDTDFLADDAVLINAGKVFRRVVVPVPQEGPVQLCLRAPASGVYAVSLLHDRDRDGRFNRSISEGDGLGFGANPSSHGPFKPRAATGRVTVGSGPTPVTIRLLYRTGLFPSVNVLKGR